MVKFDVAVFKFLTADHFRALTAIEMGMKNHEIVPTSMIEQLAHLKRGNCYRIISDLHKHKLVTHNSKPYDGYTLTFRGYDYLCINALVKRGLIVGVGHQIGVGKESDVFEVFGPKNPETDTSPSLVLKLHRLGRVSFRAVKKKRDYLSRGANKGSWLNLSRLSALKEYGFMKVLHDKDFPVPQPLSVSRHGILMSYISGFPLCKAVKIKKPAILCAKTLSLLVKLAQHGLVHCDLNEFNLMVTDDYDLFLIDFPQMISVQHPQSKEFFARDVECVLKFFNHKHDHEVMESDIPILDDAFLENEIVEHLDFAVGASGYFGTNEQIHTEDLELLHSHFESTITLHLNLNTKNDGSDDDDKNENENEEEEEFIETQSMAKTRRFLEKRKLKEALQEHKENILRGTDAKRESAESGKSKKGSGSRESSVLSEKEIRMRLKKQMKRERRKKGQKKARKTADTHKLRRSMKNEMNSIW